MLSFFNRNVVVFDAQSKFPSGILHSPFPYDTGNYDECLKVDGKFCLGFRQIGNNSPSAWYSLEWRTGAGLHLSVCLPENCTTQDASVLYSKINISAENCYTKKSFNEENNVYYTIAILSIFITVAVMSTIIEVFYYYKNPVKKLNKFLTAFSYLSNGKSFLATEKRPNQLTCVEGMRTISIMWILLSHAYGFKLRAPHTDFSQISFFYKPENMFIIEGSVSVDTFLLIGGLVLAYSLFRYDQLGVKINLLKLYLHRYVRLTPVYAICILIHANLLTYFGSGLFWNTLDHVVVKPCFTKWWTDLLYIQNYVNSEDMVSFNVYKIKSN